MNNLQITLLIIILLSLIIITFLIYRVYVDVKLKTLTYKLYAVRDSLILLLAQGKLTKDDPLFMVLYPMTNSLISNIKKINFKNFLDVSENELNQVKRDPIFVKFSSSFKKAPPEVKEVVQNLFEAFFDIFIHNSFLFRMGYYIYLKKKKSGHQYNKIKKFLRKIRPVDYQTYEQYREIENLKHSLGLA